jgi:hypothetical protein
VVNDFVFDIAGDLDQTKATDMVTKVAEFYNVPAGTAKVSEYISPCIDRTPLKSEMRFYDITSELNGDAHGSPQITAQWSLATTQELTPLPSEMAVALSFRGDYGSTPEFGSDIGPGGGRLRLRARHRGRLYIGPLGLNALDSDSTTKRAFVKNSARGIITTAAKKLMDYDEPRWGTWSRRNAAVYPLVECWVDDAFDVQRRRGEDPLVRTSVIRTD